ncbi:PAS domain S-box protein (plasmid) [Deinococcus sp. KNUC1210]|uniref:PAS domain S-box protein n=1 Tax=Deinococcus sp. KNUC1210 TaxID=2917691 RepID=UPI001EEFE550|nr:PAS domain S-box protein [Deinococcus sp. KNUC1210]ULH17039.1 PAS domain S-box protein [Deinococcus sp. KNUC1210]
MKDLHRPLPELQLLQQVVAASAVGTVITDARQADLPVMYVNPAFERLSGYAAPEVLGRNCRFMQGQDLDQPGIQAIRQAIRYGESVTTTLRNYRKDGTLFYNEITISPVCDDDGTVTHFVGYQNDVTVKEEASQEATRLQQQLTSTLERFTDGFATLDDQLHFTYVNAAAARIAGKRPEGLSGRPFFSVFPNSADSAVVQAIERARSTGLTQYAVSYLTSIGTWIDVTVYPARGGISVFLRDITEHHHIQEALRTSEARFSKVFQASPIPIIITRQRDQHFIDLNEAFVIASGYQRDEVIGRTSRELRFWVDQLQHDDIVRVLTQGDQVSNREVRLRVKSGEERDMVISVMPVELDGEPCIMNLIRDISNEKRAQQILEASELQYRQIAADLQRTLDLSVDMITSSDADGRFVSVSAACRQILGYAPEELLGRLSLEFVHPDDRAITKLEAQSVKAGQVTTTFQNRYLHKTGEVVWIEWAAVRLPGDPLIYSVARDITQRKVAAADIERLNEHLRQQLQYLTSLREIDQAIASSQELTVTLGLILDNITQQLGADAVTLLLLDPQTSALDYAVTRGFATPLQASTVQLETSLAGEVALSRQALVIPDLQTTALSSDWRGVLLRERLMAYYGVPLMAKGTVLGVIEVLHREPFEPSATWLETFDMLGAQAAIAIDNARLFAALERRNQDLRLAYDETIEGWARALDLRDKETEGHSRRVTELTVQLCRCLGVAPETLVDVRRGALLHDIGKMGIPDAVLLKPGKLSEEEWGLMKRHPEYAVRLLSPIKFLRSALDIPRCHHEKWDGSGYPAGLSGKAIPLMARAFAVVDVYDALTSDRPYRAAWTRERALQHIQRESGTHFDPEVVAAFFALLSAAAATMQ